MKDILIDVVHQVAPLFEAIRVTGTEDGTSVDAYTKDKTLFFVGKLKAVIPEFFGEFGIGSLGMLNGLLNFASYKADDSKFIVNRSKRENDDFVTEFQFKDGHGGRTNFKTMRASMVGEQASIKHIDWEASFKPTKAKISEIAQLAGLLSSEVSKSFGIHVEDETLFLTIGDKSEVKHAATIALLDNVDGRLLNSNPWFYNITQFLAILKNAGNAETTIKFSSRGVIGISVETDKGEYTFYLRGKSDPDEIHK